MYGLFNKIFKLANRTIKIVLNALGISMIRKIYKEKKKHKLSIVIMKKLLTSGKDDMYAYYCGAEDPLKRPDKFSTTLVDPDEVIGLRDEIDPDNKKGPDHDQIDLDGMLGRDHSNIEDDNVRSKETPILIAARNGIFEIVEKLLEQFPIAIHDVNEDNKNAMLLAVQNRQPRVFQILLKKNILVRDSVLRVVDESKNNVAHLAAMRGKYRPWQIAGEALQMQYEIKWFEVCI
ncbi:hypothetical protein F2P56_019180 [Juglans regia]|uniref:Uncharacterized protein n=1 Tax=Juglans regia TaxID=51240 RepID=A0A834CLP6_JUGRE|nr:hypothetical protein F2P56_019180 [Juglans regia]